MRFRIGYSWVELQQRHEKSLPDYSQTSGFRIFIIVKKNPDSRGVQIIILTVFHRPEENSKKDQCNEYAATYKKI
jgi:hypothetical protein